MWIAAAAAIASWLSSEQGRKASAAERAKMQTMLNNIKDPNFDTKDIDFPTFQVLQRYVPQVSDYVQEVDPSFVELSAQAQEGRGAQQEALRRLMEAGSAEGDIRSNIAVNQANREAAISNQGMQGQILEGMRRRGTGGSGLELAAQLQAQQSAGDRGAVNAQNAASEGYKNRLNALMQSGELGGRLKNEELSQAEKNANIINSFNQRNAANRNDYNRYSDDASNTAQRFNIGEGQRVYEKNLGGRYDAAKYNQAAQNQTAQQVFQNQMSKITGQQAQSAMNQQGISQNTQDRQNQIQGAGNMGSAYQQNQQDERRYQNEQTQRTADRQFEADQREKDRQAGLNQQRSSDKWG